MSLDDYHLCWHSDTREATAINPPSISLGGLNPVYEHDTAGKEQEHFFWISLDSFPLFELDEIPKGNIGVCEVDIKLYNVPPPDDCTTCKEVTQNSPEISESKVIFCPGENLQYIGLEIPKSDEFHGTTNWRIIASGSYNCVGLIEQYFSVQDYDIMPVPLPPSFEYLDDIYLNSEEYPSYVGLGRHLDTRSASGVPPLPSVSLTGLRASYEHDSKIEEDGSSEHSFAVVLNGSPSFMLDNVSLEATGICEAVITVHNTDVLNPPPLSTRAALINAGEEVEDVLFQDTPEISKSKVVFNPHQYYKTIDLKIPKSPAHHGTTTWMVQVSGGLNTDSGISRQFFDVHDNDIMPNVEVFSVTNDHYWEEVNGQDVLKYNIDKSVRGGSSHNPYGDGVIKDGDPEKSYPSGEANLLWFKLVREGATVHNQISVAYTPTLPTSRDIKARHESPIIFPAALNTIGSGASIQEAYFAIEIPEEERPAEGPQDVTINLSSNSEVGTYYYFGETTEAKSSFIDSDKETGKLLVGENQKETSVFAPASGDATTTTTTTLAPMLKREFGSYGSSGSTNLPQHVFLGASVSDFSLNGGFGDSVTTMNVTLVEDSVTNSTHKLVDQFGRRTTVTGNDYIGQESLSTTIINEDGTQSIEEGYSDTTEYQDIEVGDPVFFCFGESLQKPMTGHNTSHTGGPDGDGKTYTDDGNNGFNKLIYDVYGWTNTAKSQSPHFAFGGLLQSWNTNVDATGGTMHNVTIVDPREILQNFQLILNNHSGTTFGNDNLINIYGFLEHIYTTDINGAGTRDAKFYNADYMQKSWSIPDDGSAEAKDFFKAAPNADEPNFSVYDQDKPLTGIGYSLRSELGIPAFRVIQALNMLTGFHANSPGTAAPMTQYLQYGGYCKFRNKKYAIDVSALPIPDPYYQINYDTMSLLDLCMEFADACNHEVMVHLLPFNNAMSNPPWGPAANTKFNTAAIDGIIKVTTINRNNPSGKVSANYIKDLPFDVTSKDIGVELANEVTDKFVTGANEVAHYYFDGKEDTKNNGAHGMHEINRNLSKGIIPYYGLLHNNVVTFPRGRGPWTQIVLDATSCQAMGVGEYYVTTEMELRAADISFDKWVEFLQSYNHLFHEVIYNGQAIDNLDWFHEGITGSIAGWLGVDGFIVGSRECTVPRCTHPPCKKDKHFWQNGQETEQWCSPPYGYPLYWGRAGAIGLFTGSNTGGSNKNPKAIDPKGVAANTRDAQAKPKANSPEGGASNDANKNFEDAVSAYMAKTGLDNAKKVFAFVKAVADECLGKKFLIKIPQKPNENYGSGKWFFGFAPRNQDDSIPNKHISVGGEPPDGSYDYAIHKEHINPTPAINASTARKRGALTIGYNAAVGEYVFNYYPEPAGGNDPPYGTFAPPIIRSFFQENGRIPAYVKLPYEDAINMDSFDKDSTFKYAINSNGGAAVAQADGTYPEGTKQGVFLKADLDERFFVAPKFINKIVPVYGCTAQRRKDLEGKMPKKKVFDDEGEEVDISCVVPQVWGPLDTPDSNVESFEEVVNNSNAMFGDDTDPFETTAPPNTTSAPDTGTTGTTGSGDDDDGPTGVNLSHIDLDAALKQQGPSEYFHVYALITIPRATLTEEGTETYGESMKVNVSNVGHFFREDVVKGMPGFESVTVPSKVNLEGGHNPKDYKANMMKAVEGLSFCLDRRIKMFSPGPLFPEMVALPLRSTERSYGPWFNETGGDGKIEYSHDESLAPWNYGGSYAAMNTAGFMAVAQTAEADMEQERASFTMVGWPRGMSIGGFLSNGGPAITNINVSFSTEGIRTTVTMDSYTPSFGKMQKQKQALMTKMSRDKQQIRDQKNKLIKDQIINPRSRGTISKTEELFRKKARAERDKDYGSKLTAEDRGEAQPANEFAMTVSLQTGQARNPDTGTTSTVDANANPDRGDYASKAMTTVNSAVQSSKATGNMGKMLSENAFQYYKQYWLSISSSVDEVFHPASSTWHNIFPCMDQPIDLLLYKDAIDDDNEISYYD